MFETLVVGMAADGINTMLAAFALYMMLEGQKSNKRHIEEMNRQYLESIEALVGLVVDEEK